MSDTDEKAPRKSRGGKAASAGEKPKEGKAKKATSKTTARDKEKAAQKKAEASKRAAQRAEEAVKEKEAEKRAAAEAAETSVPGKEEERAGAREGRRVSEEEFQRLMEESLEKVTVADVVLTMMNQMASMGYLKMGLPESVNLKYRDLDQALLAIDILEAMVKGAEGKIAEDSLKPFRGVLANLQLNFVQLKRG